MTNQEFEQFYRRAQDHRCIMAVGVAPTGEPVWVSKLAAPNTVVNAAGQEIPLQDVMAAPVEPDEQGGE